MENAFKHPDVIYINTDEIYLKNDPIGSSFKEVELFEGFLSIMLEKADSVEILSKKKLIVKNRQLV
jgi:hypothetical protein